MVGLKGMGGGAAAASSQTARGNGSAGVNGRMLFRGEVVKCLFVIPALICLGAATYVVLLWQQMKISRREKNQSRP